MRSLAELIKIKASFLPDETLTALQYFDRIGILDEILSSRLEDDFNSLDALPLQVREQVARKMLTSSYRDFIFHRDNYTCARCHRRFPAYELEVDHIVPIALGGFSNPSNLQTLCRECHKKKTREDIEKLNSMRKVQGPQKHLFEFERLPRS